MEMCSRFLCWTPGGYKYVANPLKLLVKIGRMDLAHEGHVEEYRISLMDIVDDYKYLEVRNYLSDRLPKMYNSNHLDIETICCFLYRFVNNKNRFHSLYTIPIGKELNRDVSNTLKDI